MPAAVERETIAELKARADSLGFTVEHQIFEARVEGQRSLAVRIRLAPVTPEAKVRVAAIARADALVAECAIDNSELMTRAPESATETAVHKALAAALELHDDAAGARR